MSDVWRTDRNRQRLDIALEAIKQQITLSTAIVAAMLAFSGEIAKNSGFVWGLMLFVLVPFGACIVIGVLALMSISYHLEGEDDPLTAPLVRCFGMLQNVFFIVGVIAMIVLVTLY